MTVPLARPESLEGVRTQTSRCEFTVGSTQPGGSRTDTDSLADPHTGSEIVVGAGVALQRKPSHTFNNQVSEVPLWS